MSATITVETVLPDGTPASGSDIPFQNESVKFKDSIDWSGSADRLGICIWEDMDTGVLGDMYFFKASYVDPGNGTTFVGEKKVRIKKGTNNVRTQKNNAKSGSNLTLGAHS